MKKWIICLSLVFMLSLYGVAFSDPPDFIPPGHQYGGDGGNSNAEATAKAKAKATANQTQTQDQSITNTVNINNDPSGQTMFDDGAFRQFPETVQPRFPGAITQSPGSMGIAFLEDLKTLPPKLNLYTIQREEIQDLPKCEIQYIPWDDSPDNPKFYPDYVRYYHEGDGLERTILKIFHKGKKYRVIGTVAGICPNGNTFALDVRIREKIMVKGANGVVYFQKGKKMSPSAWSIGFFGGGVDSKMDGEGNVHSFSVTGGLGFSYGKANMNVTPGLMGYAIIVQEGGWR